MEEVMGRGRNIKCFDKVKLTHVLTGCRLHSNGFGYKSRSYNTVVSCHRGRDQTDWFVAVRRQDQSMSYHFRYGDQIILSNVESKKYLHLSEDIDSPVSKNMQVSLCQQDSKKDVCQQDEWIIQLAQSSQDDYWRVGQIIRIKNKFSSSYLCCHRRKIQENDDYEVYGQKLKFNQVNASPSTPKNKQEPIKNSQKYQESLWIVSQITPFIYTASISEQKKVKLTEQAQEIKKLKATVHNIPRKQIKKSNETEEILKMQNRRMEQLEIEKLKLLQAKQKRSIWRRYFCCCCDQNAEAYTKLK